MSIQLVSQNKCFGGIQSVFSHSSKVTNCIMRFAVFLPRQAETKKVPGLFWLSGLTCSEENFIIKAGAQRVAAELGLALIVPDTSPRGLQLPGEDECYDLGTGAGFYVDATHAPWNENYKMYTYIVKELPDVITAHYPIDANRIGIFGHSMGGHGALIIGLRNPSYFKSISAFAPITSAMHCPWGEKALMAYLGPEQAAWAYYDATALILSRGWQGDILVDQGTKDPYLQSQLKPTLLREACAKANVRLNLRMQEGYDHSYFFIMTFIEDHLRFHFTNLN